MKQKRAFQWLLAAIVAAALAVLAGCDIAKDTAETGVKGGEGAGSVANKMKGGTVGDTDMDTGESASEETEPAEGSGE
jgi:hypothetical protein